MPQPTKSKETSQDREDKKRYDASLVAKDKRLSLNGILYTEGDLVVTSHYTFLENNSSRLYDKSKKQYRRMNIEKSGKFFDLIQSDVDPSTFWHCYECSSTIPSEEMTRKDARGDNVLLAKRITHDQDGNAKCPYDGNTDVVPLTEYWEIEEERSEVKRKEFLRAHSKISDDLRESIEKIQTALERQGENYEATLKTFAEALTKEGS